MPRLVSWSKKDAKAFRRAVTRAHAKRCEVAVESSVDSPFDELLEGHAAVPHKTLKETVAYYYAHEFLRLEPPPQQHKVRNRCFSTLSSGMQFVSSVYSVTTLLEVPPIRSDMH